VSLYGPTLSKCKNLLIINKAILASSPIITGAILRLLISVHVNNSGGKKVAIVYLFLATLGIIANNVIMFNINLS